MQSARRILPTEQKELRRNDNRSIFFIVSLWVVFCGDGVLGIGVGRKMTSNLFQRRGGGEAMAVPWPDDDATSSTDDDGSHTTTSTTTSTTTGLEHQLVHGRVWRGPANHDFATADQHRREPMVNTTGALGRRTTPRRTTTSLHRQ
jgi:hypothetical protein